ncbi:Polyamine-transporting ATPase (plasmid) [Deinococcus proteolyticus MRP]|uniref:Polyamine-transporting ATPase n=1 Tax=Deinococcus proteolyticus (strain ATCC 35074 / DSM 20540 / JCM 6276 / NBRC 101906 / NCIMB 13154 / VKM Ac-1939 / CCM 2703 / MRP) TaxID=693977 RepID=F0RPU9_DEIPM|nr:MULTISPECIES: ATP-binding cassette domain-containing protein [Deinococcus]ADY27405.1 Polyamine-transporting ATPase [Deinococcus proteolyticus MRP]MCY1704023.1 ATP-binding cassette domain-containing protein [Deinococcus sp. SL84]
MTRPKPVLFPGSTQDGAELSLQEVAYRYRTGQATASSGAGPLNFRVVPGEFLSVVGPSGSGKSTLLGLLAGFLSPQQGEIRLDGTLLRGPHPRLTLVQQEAALFPWLTVGGNVRFGLRGLPRAEQDRRVQDSLALVGLPDLGGRRIHELSGGQRQRVSLARALATRPGVLLLDEPFSALDVATRERLSAELLDIWRQRGVTVVFVTHHLEEALALGERVMALRGGETVLDAPTAGLSLPELEAALR